MVEIKRILIIGKKLASVIGQGWPHEYEIDYAPNNFYGASGKITRAEEEGRPIHVIFIETTPKNNGGIFSLLYKLKNFHQKNEFITVCSGETQETDSSHLTIFMRHLSVDYAICLVENRIEKMTNARKKEILESIGPLIPTNVLSAKIETEKGYHPGAEILLCQINGKLISIPSLFLVHRKDLKNFVCVSPTRGCSRNCRKCFSASLKPPINLSSEEIVSLVWTCLNEATYFICKNFWLDFWKICATIMGSGDIAFNFNQTMNAMLALKRAFGTRFVCEVSTAFIDGVSKLINFVEAGNDVVPNLQISLDSFTPNRTKIIDSLEDPFELVRMAERYYSITGKKIKVNFVMCQGINDSPEEVNKILSSLNRDYVTIKLTIPNLPRGLYPTNKRRVLEIRNKMVGFGFGTEIFDGGTMLGQNIGADCGNITHGEKKVDPKKLPRQS